MTPLITIAIPVSTYHLHHLPRALASVRAQTIPVEVLVYYDEHQRGAGYARNRLIDQCMTDMITFLDADDELMPEFAAKTLAFFQITQKYVFTDYLQGDGTRWLTPDCVYAEHERMHLITTLLPTAWARAVGGFNDKMDADEDSEFYIHLNSTGYCGVRLPEPLVIYHIDGQRSGSPEARQFRQTAFHAEMRKKYRGNWMECCGDLPTATPQMGEKVLVRPTWGFGTRSKVGIRSGIRYPNVDSNDTLEIDRRDLEAQPFLWQVIEQPKPAPVNEADTFDELANFARNGLHLPQKAKPFQAPPAPVANVKPDVERVMRLAQSMVTQVSNPPVSSAPTTLEALQERLSFPPVKSNDGGWTMDAGMSANYQMPTTEVDILSEEAREIVEQAQEIRARWQSAPLVKRTTDPVFVFPDKDYPSYTDVRRLVELSGFEAVRMGRDEIDYDASAVYIYLSPEHPRLMDVDLIPNRVIWWTLEYGGEYEPDLTHWRGEVWACDPTWARSHGAKFIVMGSHPALATVPPVDSVNYPIGDNRMGRYSFEPAQYDYVMLAYMTPRRQALKDQLRDLTTPAEIYPGYQGARAEQLAHSRLMLHAHQRDDTPAIAPQRFALCAAYKLPLIHEAVPHGGKYYKYAAFSDYDALADRVRLHLASPIESEGIGKALHDWLCVEHTFRKSVEDALK